jgi:hypothetical protein
MISTMNLMMMHVNKGTLQWYDEKNEYRTEAWCTESCSVSFAVDSELMLKLLYSPPGIDSVSLQFSDIVHSCF